MNTIKSIFRNKIFRVCLILIIVTYPFFKDFEFIYSVGDSMLPSYENGELILIWVIGDNRHMSWYGLIKIKDIKGLVLY